MANIKNWENIHEIFLPLVLKHRKFHIWFDDCSSYNPPWLVQELRHAVADILKHNLQADHQFVKLLKKDVED
jgi:hypothetical protein